MNEPWVETIRRETGLVEHVCKHGVGHPAHGSVHWMELHGIKDMGIHGCDGCCMEKDWIIADLKASTEIANTHIKKLVEKIKRIGYTMVGGKDGHCTCKKT